MQSKRRHTCYGSRIDLIFSGSSSRDITTSSFTSSFLWTPPSSRPRPHVPAPLGCRVAEVSLLAAQGKCQCRSCLHRVEAAAGFSQSLPSFPCLRPPCWDHKPRRKAGNGCHPLPLCGVLLSPKHGFAFPSLPSATQAPRDKVTVKPPLPASGLRALTSFQVFSGMGVGVERVAVVGVWGIRNGESTLERSLGVPRTLVSEAVLSLPSNSLCNTKARFGRRSVHGQEAAHRCS